MNVYQVKFTGAEGAIEAYAVRYGSPGEPDRSKEKDFFSPETDLMLEEWGWPRPIFMEHMMTEAAQRAGSVGKWLGATKDAVGVKLRGQLKPNHPLFSLLVDAIKAGKYYLSTDSAPQFVKRRPLINGTNHLDRWGLLTASLTVRPAEHRLLPVEMVKALALKAGARHSASDAKDLQAMHDLTVRQGATCTPAPAKSDPRARRILAEPKAIEEDHMLDLELDLDMLEWQLRMERELATLERI